MPARPGVDDKKHTRETKFILARRSVKSPSGLKLETFMGDQNEVCVKLVGDWQSAVPTYSRDDAHRRWYPDGIEQIILNLEAISLPGRDVCLELKDNKDRYTLMWIDDKGVFHMGYNRARDEMFKVPWDKFKAAIKKAADLKT